MSTALPTIPTCPPININFVKSCNILAVTALNVLAAEPSIQAIPKGFIHWFYFLPVDQGFLFFCFSNSILLYTRRSLTVGFLGSVMFLRGLWVFVLTISLIAAEPP